MLSPCQAQGECHQPDLLEGLRGARHRAVQGPLVPEFQEGAKPESGVLGATANIDKKI